MKFKLYFFLFFTITCFAQDKNSLLDSIFELRKLSNQTTLSNEERVLLAQTASRLSLETKSDTTFLNSDRNLSYVYLMTDNYDLFGETTLNNLQLAKRLKDSVAIANSSNNLGYYNYQIKEDNNAAYKYYLIALQYFDELSHLKEKATVLINIATIQDDEKDYLGSEQSAIEALKILNGLEDNKDEYIDKYLCLNLLGIISLNLGNYRESIDYSTQAYEITKKLKNGYYKGFETKNNLAIAYRDSGDLDKALNIYKELLENSDVLKEDLTFYPLVIENNAYTKFLKGGYDYEELELELKKAFIISDSINDQFARLAVSIDLAKFYKSNSKLDSAYKYAIDSYRISKEIPVNELYLESMLILAGLTKGEISKSYLEAHIALSDSLLNVERNVRNKFARIKYGTDQIEAENEQITKENLYLAIVSIGLLLTAILIYIVISQRAKNKELKLMQVQQKANEDIYNLMLVQQDKVDEARAKEKIRVSKELHDGVLGRLFGVRLSLDSINFKEGKEVMLDRAKYIGQLQTVEQDIRKISHDLNTDFVSGSGFIDIVTELVENQTQAYNLEHQLNYTDDISWDLVSNKTKINIYRIIQESMQNIYKHANAKAIKISISLEKGLICLDIIDDGDGFDTAKSKKGIGLKNMRSRVQAIEGNITFLSQSGSGTEVNVKIPYINQST